MEEQNRVELLPEKPAKPKKRAGKIIAIIFAVIALLGLTGYGVYAWQQSRVENLKKSVDELNSTVEELNNNVEKLKKEAEESSDVSQNSNTTKTQNTQVDVYSGWKTFTSKFGTSFRYPPGYTVTTQIDSNSSLQQAINNGTNVIEVTSYVPDGELDCAQVGMTIPVCEVKVSFRVLSGKVESSIIPQNSTLRTEAQKIIDSLK